MDALFKPSPLVENIIEEYSTYISLIQQEYKLPHKYLTRDVVLHLFKYYHEDLVRDSNYNEQLVKLEIQNCATHLSKDFGELTPELLDLLNQSKSKSKIVYYEGRLWEIAPQGRIAVELKGVNRTYGQLIQSKLHYIKAYRSDTVYEYGLFREGEEFPFAYAAYSTPDRNYQTLGLPVQFNNRQILYLNRVFNLNNAPQNSTSILLGHSQKIIYNLLPNLQAIITSINPNLLFTAASFRGANFYPYAKFPFLPQYYQGRYVTRKSILALNEAIEIKMPNLATQDIVLMGSGLTKKSKTAFETITAIYQISAEQYAAG